MRRSRRKAWLAAFGILGGLTLAVAILHALVVSMPGESVEGALPPLTADEELARDRMRLDLEVLSNEIGERNTRIPPGLERAATFIEDRLRAAGHEPSRQTFEADRVATSNIEVVLPGESEASLVLGAHYDTAPRCPGANDNGTGVVALLELARRLKGSSLRPTVRMVFFTNEEPPYFGTDLMGSRVYADDLAARGVPVVGMLSLETMGFYSDEDGSQAYPPVIGALYPDRGDFIAFVGNVDSRSFVREVVGAFREEATIPSEGSAPPSWVPAVDFSDHASFWRHGWPALMVTDTAPFRYAHYHTMEDTPDKVDHERLARVTVGIERVVRRLGSP